MSSYSRSLPPALVVGTGFGCRIHVPALRAAGFDVVGLIGTDIERTRKRAQASGVAQSFTDLDEAIARTGAHVVSIATPPHTHAPLTFTALARGCHVLCEKPFAKDLAEARAMLAAAERAGVVHLIAHEFRWGPDRALLARAIADGLIGEPRMLTMSGYMPQLASADAKMPRWWFDREVGGGWLGAHGSHMIDQIRCWLGEFASLSASLPMVSDRSGVAEDSYSLSFELANGVSGVLQQTAGAWGSPAAMTRVAGTRGTLWVEDGRVHLADREGTRELAVPDDLQLPDVGGDPRNLLLPPFVRLCEALRAAIDGRPNSAVPPPTFADGVAGMQVLDAIRASAASGGARVALS
ncbi:Gfo/Idh/MocA family protein [Hydrocarboniphaga sp.]|uniref:Gfo/Idh/MocA family protein n=1 Tax=Hydrocarboniphaga sp. TaxID=2033016 RepID=UPI003D0FFB41